MPEESPDIAGTSPVVDADKPLSSIGDDIIVNSAVVCGKRHVLAAYHRALRNMERGSAVGSSMATEFFRQLTGERQVSMAIERARIREGHRAVLISYDVSGALRRMGLDRDDSALECNAEKIRHLSGKEAPAGDPEDYALEMSALVEIS